MHAFGCLVHAIVHKIDYIVCSLDQGTKESTSLDSVISIFAKSTAIIFAIANEPYSKTDGKRLYSQHFISLISYKVTLHKCWKG